MARNPNLCHPPKTTPILRRADKGVYAPCTLAEDLAKQADFLAEITPEPTPKRRRKAR